MRLRSLAPCVLALSIAAACQADAAGADPRHTYVLRLADAPLVEHAAARAEQQGLVATLGRRAALRTVLSSDDSAGYLAHLDAAREAVLAAGGKALGRTLPPRHAYRYASNGVALELTDAEARQLASLPGVAGVHRERIEHVLTDAGPQWIGADKLWNGQVAGAAKTKGEGVVIGIVDTGINPTHPSFAATGGDGYTHTNPRGHFYGKCADGTLSSCNAKLIGIYDMTDEGTNGIDSAGHGSHVSGIAAGNAITDALQGNTVSLPRNVSGVAPHANIIMYKACKVDTSGQSGGSCGESDLIAALDQATADGVDVINYSIGGDAQDPFQLLAENSDAAAMFNARNAGIVVVVAAGNEGPGAHSITEPANAPWVLAVANASHNRRFANSVGDFSGVAGAPGTLQGLGYTAGYGPADIVYAGDFGNALCGKGATEGTSPTGASNPFAPGTFHGQIVVCDRGTYARVEKGYNVKAA
ncbi:MAG TPA: S8 family serine peptidase, partial [Rudaea sp.]|nr:S8 family serine peptidase [Rudaea sp.]